MKMLLTADNHIKQGLYLTVGLDYLDYIYEYCKKHEISSIVFLGDLLDKSNKIHNDVFIPLFKKIEFFHDNGIEMWFILGNHDITSTLTNSSILETFERFGHLVSSPETFTFGNTIINMVPYTKDDNLVPTVNADYLFTHLSICEFDFGNNHIANSAEHQAFNVNMFSNYKKVFTGHFHKRQQKYNIEYIGSPYQLTFGDAGDLNRGFVVFDTDSGEEDFVRYTFAPKFVKYSYDELLENVKNNKLKKEDFQNNLVKIIVNKKVEELSKLKSVLYNTFGVVDIISEFEVPSPQDLVEENQVQMNSSISEMLEEFISKISTNVDGFEIKGINLVEKYRELKANLWYSRK